VTQDTLASTPDPRPCACYACSSNPLIVGASVRTRFAIVTVSLSPDGAGWEGGVP